jgi:hypothetical protein
VRIGCAAAAAARERDGGQGLPTRVRVARQALPPLRARRAGVIPLVRGAKERIFPVPFVRFNFKLHVAFYLLGA